jgi:hypothetical protein
MTAILNYMTARFRYMTARLRLMTGQTGLNHTNSMNTILMLVFDDRKHKRYVYGHTAKIRWMDGETVCKSPKTKNLILGHTWRFLMILYRDAKNKIKTFGVLQTVAVAANPFYIGHYGTFIIESVKIFLASNLQKSNKIFFKVLAILNDTRTIRRKWKSEEDGRQTVGLPIVVNTNNWRRNRNTAWK